ncbi:MAG TPA: NAD(P)-dependent oxidoreductase [Egicoccus sp.]|nr:NAD(P)-dependent oxidoreductase [Egicoccus sp.]HSK23037.1 NAD(P)-dependent oxidoreductase [Egicoccus sp.]
METLPDKPTIGWIGAGRMGYAMIERLLGAGHDVTVWNRTRAKAEPLSERGATIVDDAADLADRDVVFSIVSASKDLLQVLQGEGGLLTREGTAPKVIIDSSTVDPDASAKARAMAADAGAEFLAAPVSGNPKVIAAGKLNFAVSGDRHVFDAVESILTDIGQGAYYVGEDEVARLVKLCHNLYLGLVTQSLIEVTILAQKGGASRHEFLRFLNDSAMGSVFSRYKTPALVNLDFHPTFTMPLLRKDFDLGLGMARDLEVPMPVTAHVHHIIQSAIGQGHVDEDFASLIMLQAAAAGMDIEPENVDVDTGL